MSLKTKISPKLVSLVFGILVGCFIVGFYILAWTEPTATPPADNVPLPLNVSNIGQAKGGGLMLGTAAGVGSGLIVLGEKTDPVGGVCPAGYDWYDMNNNSAIDTNECIRTVIHTKSTGGNVGIGTTDPTEKLDVSGNVKASQFITGDIIFQKDEEKIWRMFDDEDGLYVENLKTGKVYRFILEEVSGE